MNFPAGRLHSVLALYRVYILNKQHHFSSGQHRDRNEAERVRFLCSANFYRHLSKCRKPSGRSAESKVDPKHSNKQWRVESKCHSGERVRWKFQFVFSAEKSREISSHFHELSTWLQGGYSKLKHSRHKTNIFDVRNTTLSSRVTLRTLSPTPRR